MSIGTRLRSITSGASRLMGWRSGPDPVEVDAGNPVAPEENVDPAHAGGHRHIGPPPETSATAPSDTSSPRNQPWVRTTHSDSQKRRFRR